MYAWSSEIYYYNISNKIIYFRVCFLVMDLLKLFKTSINLYFYVLIFGKYIDTINEKYHLKFIFEDAYKGPYGTESEQIYKHLWDPRTHFMGFSNISM